MKPRYWALLVLAGLIALTPLAYASPPDPSWIRGIYDDGDADDVVVLLTSGGGVVEPFPLETTRAIPMAASPVFQRDEPACASPTLSANPPRAPPSV